MRGALGIASVVLGVAGLVALSTDTACSPVPAQFCRGASINRKGGEASPDLGCTKCVEEQCCDLVGDCQGSDCAPAVAAAHACVLDAGRGAGAAEPECRSALEGDDQRRDTYQCMRDRCGEACGLPVCKLEPLVPRIGELACDRCFAGSCCAEMNACAKNRTCLLTLECIASRCRTELTRALTREQHPAAQALVDLACAAEGAPPPEAQGCIAGCIAELAPDESEDAREGRCLAARVNECGADVGCGPECAAAPVDAGADG